MEGFIGGMQNILEVVVEVCTMLMEFAGIAVLVVTAVTAFYHWVTRTGHNIRLDLGEGIALALEFKMGGEVLRTVVVREWEELGILGAIIVLRAGLTFLIHREIKEEKQEEEKKDEENRSQLPEGHEKMPAE